MTVNVAKRFTDTEKWKDPWFLELSTDSKVLFLFLCDHCDTAGFYERADKITSYYTNIPAEKLDACHLEIEKSAIPRQRWVFLKNFIRHQKNLPLNYQNYAHRSIIRNLVLRGKLFGDLYLELFGCSFDDLSNIEGAFKGLQSPLGKGIGKGNSLEECEKPFLKQEPGFLPPRPECGYCEGTGLAVRGEAKGKRCWCVKSAPPPKVEKRPNIKHDVCKGTGFLPDRPGARCWCWS